MFLSMSMSFNYNQFFSFTVMSKFVVVIAFLLTLVWAHVCVYIYLMITLLVYNNFNILIGDIGVLLYHLHHQQSIADSHSRGMCLVARPSILVKTDIEVILALDLLTTLAVHMIHLCKGHHSFQKYHPSLLNGKCVIIFILKIHCSLKYSFYLIKS